MAMLVGSATYSDCEEGASLSVEISVGARVNEVWYRTSPGPLARGADAFLAATLVPAMRLGEPLVLSDVVSPRLLEGTVTIQDILTSWDRTLKRVEIRSGVRETRHPTTQRGTACFFSGGVDSFYTLLKHREEISAMILVHGFDIALDSVEVRTRTSQAARAVAAALDKTLIEVETNLRAFSDPLVEWTTLYHGAALASIALILAPRFRKVLVAATDSYRFLPPWGSHPILDPLWGTEAVEIVHDGCEVTRMQKVEYLAQHDIALQYLRVCVNTGRGMYNCGRCPKCLRTMASLRIVGALDRCPVFSATLDGTGLGRLRRIEMTTNVQREFMIQNLEAAEQRGDDPELQQALRDAVEGLYYQGPKGWPRRALQHARRHWQRLTAHQRPTSMLR